MNEQNPQQRLRLLREAEPLFTDPVAKYSVLYPNLIDAYLELNELNAAAKAVDEMGKSGAQGVTEAESRLHLAAAYMKAQQYDPALQQFDCDHRTA